MVKIGNIQLPDFPLLLAPMEDVSDPPFRRLCKQHGADLMYSEFISSEGLIRDAIKSRQKLDIFDYERPVGIQIFGGDEEAMALSAKIVDAVNPDLIDINFGCPVKKVVCKGAGAAVLKDVDLMVWLTKAVIKSTHLPVTVKTRLGWDFDIDCLNATQLEYLQTEVLQQSLQSKQLLIKIGKKPVLDSMVARLLNKMRVSPSGKKSPEVIAAQTKLLGLIEEIKK